MAVLQLDSNLRAGNEEGHNGFLGLMSRILTPLKIRNQQIFKHLGDLLKNVKKTSDSSRTPLGEVW